MRVLQLQIYAVGSRRDVCRGIGGLWHPSTVASSDRG